MLLWPFCPIWTFFVLLLLQGYGHIFLCLAFICFIFFIYIIKVEPVCKPTHQHWKMAKIEHYVFSLYFLFTKRQSMISLNVEACYTTQTRCKFRYLICKVAQLEQLCVILAARWRQSNGNMKLHRKASVG